MDAIIEKNIEDIRKILSGNHVKRAYLFGSMAHGHVSATSDVDLFIEFDADISIEEYGSSYFIIHEALESLLKRPVELLTPRSMRNPVFIREIESTRIPIFG